jgi:hypothetical protein
MKKFNLRIFIIATVVTILLNFLSLAGLEAHNTQKRASKYDAKLAKNASFDEIIKLSATPYRPALEKPVKSKKKK